jgi:hypothetical protein
MQTLTIKKSSISKKLSALFILIMMITVPSFGQLYAPEGLNMPGDWNGFANPPGSGSVFGGVQSSPNNGIQLLPSGIYQTKINVSASGDVESGIYAWLFTSGPSTNQFGNKWGNVLVSSNTIQTYNNNGADNQVTLNNNRWYTVNFENAGYADNRAVFMETSGEPVAISSVSQSPVAGSVGDADAVTVTANISASPSPEEIFYLRYSTNNFASSTVVAMTATASTTYQATIPAQAAATAVSYYIFSSTLSSFAGADSDLITINTNTNGGSNYNYIVNSVSNWDITFRVNMQNETVGGNVYLAGNFNTFSTSADPMTETVPGSGIYEITKSLAQGFVAEYKFTNGASFEGNLGAPCGNGSNRTYTVGSADATIATSCFGFCTDCVAPVNVTFQVNMSNETVGGAVNVSGSFNGWGFTAMTPIGGGVYSVTAAIPPATNIEYKFVNGASYEGNLGAPCGNGSNRTYTVPASAATIPVACFGSCTNCTSPVNITFRVNMADETPGVVSVAGSFNGFNTTANIMTETVIGSGIYTATVSILSGTNITYKFVNDGGFEGNLGAPCGNGADRTYTVPASATTLPLVCFSSCNNCVTPSSTWTSVTSGTWTDGSIWDQGTVPPVGADIVIGPSTTVTLNTNAVANTFTISGGATFNGSDGLNRTLTVQTAGFFSNSGIINSTSTFTLIMSGGNNIFGNPVLNNLELNGGVQILGNTIVNGILTINTGGFFNGGSSPSYGPSSTLVYNTGGTFGRGLEWNGLIDFGYPNNLQISNNTILQPGANSGQGLARAIRGNLVIDAGSAMYMDWGGFEMTQPISIGGNLVLNGSLSLSSFIGGDFNVRGNVTIDAAASFNANGRSFSFNGNSQQLNGTALSVTFAFLTKSGNNNLTLNIPTTVTNDLFIASGSVVANADLTLNNGGTLGSLLTINSGRTLAVTGGTLNTNGSLTLNSGASLLHGAGTPGGGGAVVGNVRVKRAGQTTPSFNFWSSPVANSNATILGPDRFYYDPSTGTQSTADDTNDPGWIAATGTMSNGRGYASSNAGTVTFNGSANTGNVNQAVIASPLPNSRFNLLGNPYPSAISANQFLALNGPSGSNLITGSIYFWDDDNSAGADYTSTDYAVWNGAGSVGGGGNTPNGNIGSGQGFFVEGVTTGSVQFTNSMRTNNNTQFFQNEAIKRVRLSISNEHGDYNETLIAFLNDATEEADANYDALKLRGNPNISFFSKINDDAYAIQGLPDSFDNRIVNLGFQNAYNENHTISLASLELIPATVMIYLEDRETGAFINLRTNSSYTFMPGSMSSEDRFSLHFTAPIEAIATSGSCDVNLGSLEISNPSAQDISYEVFNAENNLIAQGSGNTTSIEILNLVPDNYTVELTMDGGYETAVQTEVLASQMVELSVNVSSFEVNTGEFVQLNASSNGNVTWFINNTDASVISGNNFTMSFSEAGIYNVIARSTNGTCDSEINVAITVRGDVATSIANANESSFSISPNPAEDFARITLPENVKAGSVIIELTDLTGKLIMSEQVSIAGNTVVLSLNNVEAGMYLVSLTSNGTRNTSRLIVK